MLTSPSWIIHLADCSDSCPILNPPPPPLPPSLLHTWDTLHTPKGDAPLIPLLSPQLLSTTSSHQIFSRCGWRGAHPGSPMALTHCLTSSLSDTTCRAGPLSSLFTHRGNREMERGDEHLKHLGFCPPSPERGLVKHGENLSSVLRRELKRRPATVKWEICPL